MVQARRVKSQGQARAKAVWADRPRQARAAIVSALNAAQRLSMRPESLAITVNARNVEQKWQKLDFFGY